MKIKEGMQNAGYGLLFILTIVVIYMVQHNCVKYGFDAAVSAYDSVVEWSKSGVAKTS